MVSLGLLAAVMLLPSPCAALEVESKQGRLEIHDQGKTVFGWQSEPLDKPRGGEKFAGSAFIHPLTTPSGFALTAIQPPDHLHHFGVWWPWKYLEIEGAKFNCWELQSGEGRQRAIEVKVVARGKERIELACINQHEQRVGDAYRPVLREQVELVFQRLDGDAYQLDIVISQKPVEKVTVKAYRYSGFSWRGPEVWNRDNSQMLTSGGHDRRNANHQPARWVMVGGETPTGQATMLLLSAAAMEGGDAELLRVWGPEAHKGMPFVNFNPVVRKSMTLDQPAVAKRAYRLILADRKISAKQADEYWQAWAAKP